jgi:hypothetical protein
MKSALEYSKQDGPGHSVKLRITHAALLALVLSLLVLLVVLAVWAPKAGLTAVGVAFVKAAFSNLRNQLQ